MKRQPALSVSRAQFSAAGQQQTGAVLVPDGYTDTRSTYEQTHRNTANAQTDTQIQNQLWDRQIHKFTVNMRTDAQIHSQHADRCTNAQPTCGQMHKYTVKNKQSPCGETHNDAVNQWTNTTIQNNMQIYGYTVSAWRNIQPKSK